MTFPLGLLLLVLGCTLAAVAVLMAASFVIGKSSGKYSVIDAVWGPGFALTAVVAFLVSLGHGAPSLRWLLLAMVVVWGLRLGGYILLRNRGLPEDPRYADMLADAAGPGVIVRTVQIPQGVTMWFVSFPVQVGMLLPGEPGPVVWVGLGIYLVGLFFESFGDAQLAAFKKDPANKGLLMDRGLWRYTRHPNYFGDACVWSGIFVTVTWSWIGWLTLLSPILMIWLLTVKTGKALTEKHMSSTRPGYAEYVARTSGFFPLSPKKTPAT